MKKFWLCLVLCLIFALPLSAQNLEDIPLEDPAVPTLPTPIPAPVAAQKDNLVSLDFMRHALQVGVLVAALCGYLGLFVVARRMVFIGVALAEMSSAGIALGLLLGFAPLWGALGFMVLGVFLFARRWAPRRLPDDAPIGVFYVLAIALGILLIAKSPLGETHMLHLLQGDVLAADPRETWEMAGVFAVLAAIHVLFARQFQIVSLDRDMASTMGFASANWDFLLFLTIGIAVSLAIRSAGVLMTATMLIVPATTALLAVARWRAATILAPILAILAVGIGLWVSLQFDFPASSVIVAVSFAFLIPVWAFQAVVRRT